MPTCRPCKRGSWTHRYGTSSCLVSNGPRILPYEQDMLHAVLRTHLHDVLRSAPASCYSLTILHLNPFKDKAVPLPNKTQPNIYGIYSFIPQAVASAANSQSEKQSAASQEALSYVKGLQDRLHTLELGSLKSESRCCMWITVPQM